jgi:hypothetical protein
MKSPSILLSVVLLSTFSAFPARAGILLNDTFADGNRGTQNLPVSAAFYHGGSSGQQSLEVVSQALAFDFQTTPNQLGQFVGYFTDAGVTTLQVGDKLSFQFTFSASAINNDASSIRIGLFNSGGDRVEADTTGIADAAFDGSTGYSFWNSQGTGTATGGFRQRTGTSTTLWASGANTNLGTQTLARLDYAAATTYTLTFALERMSATDMKVSFQDNDGNVFTRTDTAGIFTGFDTFSVFLGNGTVGDVSYIFDDFLITYTPVPEPGSAVGIVSGLAAAMLLRRRGMRG